ncbi:MAG: type II secretion system protein [Planctomycetota bacterium]
MKKDNAFTLMELVMVVVIIGILISIAVPLSREAILRTRVKDAKSNLRAMYAAQKAYRMKYGAFYGDYTADEATINQVLHLDLERGYWEYSVSGNLPGMADHWSSPRLGFKITEDSQGEPYCYEPVGCQY